MTETAKPAHPEKLPGIDAPAGICPPGDPFETCTWVRRDTWVKDFKTGTVVFEQRDVECPSHWSQEACNIVASKYFFGRPGTPDRESSIRAVLHRIAAAITSWGQLAGHFTDDFTGDDFYRDLVYLMLHQYAAFNSPVWFNVGLNHVYKAVGGGGSVGYWHNEKTGRTEAVDPMVRPQASACFILGLQDSIQSIWATAGDSAALFKFGSGVGMDLSPLRSYYEHLSGGGKASGACSFGKLIDVTGGTIKSGGRTRRAAIMLTIKDRHPEFRDFIGLKAAEEKKAKALIAAGYDSDFNGDAYGTVGFQNANLSTRLSDAFLDAAERDLPWQTRWVTEPDRPGPTLAAAECLNAIAQGTWDCGDPGVQYDDTIQKWHTCPNSGEVHSSNPCCLRGDALVDTSEGRVRLDALAAADALGQELPYAFCYDTDQRRPALRKILRAWKSGESSRLVRVTTDKGVTITCTPEHRFLTYSGEYVRADRLRVGQSLRKIARHVNTHRSNRVMLSYTGCGTSSGAVYQSRWMWQQVNGEPRRDQEVHHKNEDTTDDRLSNLEVKDRTGHRELHSRGEANPRFIEIAESDLLAVYDYLDEHPNQKRGESVTVARWNRAVRALGLTGRVPIARYDSGVGIVQGTFLSVVARKMEELRVAANDTVALVEEVRPEAPVAVYDIEVEGVHNFAVTSQDDYGTSTIVVHNSEYMFLDDTACNLASLRLTKFCEDGVFKPDLFRRAVRILFRAMEILVGQVSYPTARVAENSIRFRPLGIGYADLGAMLMASGVAYDSANGRAVCGAVTALMTGEAYLTSAHMARQLGAFAGFAANRAPMLRVMRQHHAAVAGLRDDFTAFNAGLVDAADESWRAAIAAGEQYGYRNAQASVLAPTGTIGFAMDCSTTGIEPELGLVKYKLLAGGGTMKLVNSLVDEALTTLGYGGEDVDRIVAFVNEHGRVEGCPGVRDEHLPVFDTSLAAAGGTRSIPWKAHIAMMAAAQPFLSGAISKTVNMPKDATPADVKEAILYGWRRGLKAVALYRDGSKFSQPLSTSADGNNKTSDKPAAPQPYRRKLPRTRASVTHHFRVGDHDGYVTAGMYDDGALGEIFVKMNKEGSTIAGLMDTISILTSLGLQNGVPLDLLVDKLSYLDFEPRGMTGNPDVPTARSVVDYIFRWLGHSFDKKAAPADAQGGPVELEVVAVTTADVVTGPPCATCGSMTVRTGPCYSCRSCGTSTGGCG